MKQFLTILLLVLLIAACSSTGDPESELLSGTSSAPATEQQPATDPPAASQQAVPQPASQQPAPQPVPSISSEPVVVTVPTGIPELPEAMWPTMNDPSPTAEDALKDYLLHHLYEPDWSLGYRIVVGCAGVEANSNVMCARDPQILDEGDLQVHTYKVGPPPPEATLYSIGIQGSVSEGWWILWANAIAR